MQIREIGIGGALRSACLRIKKADFPLKDKAEGLDTAAAPRIDNGIVSNCTTHIYGRMSAPTTIEAIKELMAAKGGARRYWQAEQRRMLLLLGRSEAAHQDTNAPMLKLLRFDAADRGRGYAESPGFKQRGLVWEIRSMQAQCGPFSS